MARSGRGTARGATGSAGARARRRARARAGRGRATAARAAWRAATWLELDQRGGQLAVPRPHGHGGRSQVVHQRAQLLGTLVERRRDPVGGSMSLDTSCGLRAAHGLRDPGDVAQQRLEMGASVFSPRRRRREALGQVSSPWWRLGARAGHRTPEHLVELHGDGGLRQRDRAAVGELGGARAARSQLDDEAALEEHPRADRARRVAVDGPAACP